MKIIIGILLLIIFFMACDTTISSNPTGDKIMGQPIEIIRLDGCQYYMGGRGSTQMWVTHKGNCDNPIHKNKQNETEK